MELGFESGTLIRAGWDVLDVLLFCWKTSAFSRGRFGRGLAHTGAIEMLVVSISEAMGRRNGIF